MSNYLDTLSDEQVAHMRDHFYYLGWGQNETMWKCWCQAFDYLAPQLSAAQQKLEAAEARIKASQEQEPVGHYNKSGELTLWMGYDSETDIFTSPVIPPDVAELQRENAKLREGVKTIPEYMQMVQQLQRNAKEFERDWLDACEKNAELTRKLEESEKTRKQYFAEMCEVIEKNEELTRKLAEQELQLEDLFGGIYAVGEGVDDGWKDIARARNYDYSEELTKLLAEAKAKALKEVLENVSCKHWDCNTDARIRNMIAELRASKGGSNE